MKFLEDMPRFVFFTGKGGVGKTSLACATAVHLAGAGRRVLLVSTDPASNVGQVFGQPIGNRVTPVVGVEGLDALEIDPESAAEQYRERILGPVRAALPASETAWLTEQLSGSCTTEIASFNEFTGLLSDPTLVADYDNVRDLRMQLRVASQSTVIVYRGTKQTARVAFETNPERLRAAFQSAL